ncbi:MAG: NUDIX domain-containing protein [Bacteroidales bacterium]
MKYTIYNYNHELLITDNDTLTAGKDIIFCEPFDWTKIISAFDEKSLCLISSQPDSTFKEFQSNYHSIVAAGGLILNDNNEWLMIYRLNKWDLPKGKMDKGETPLQAAVREIAEECNVHLQSDKCSFLVNTYHTYKLNNTKIFKKTHWFLCQYKQIEMLIPQTEEDIEKVEWVNTQQWEKYKQNSYPSIIQVINKYLNNNY